MTPLIGIISIKKYFIIISVVTFSAIIFIYLFIHFFISYSKTTNLILSIDRKILEISKAQPNDAGIYTCTGYNEAASKDKNFNVTVYGKSILSHKL